MRTNAELFTWYEDNKEEDVFRFKLEVAFLFFTEEQQRPYRTKEALWTGLLAITEEVVLTQMKNYMKFAWMKALGHRGISACRSVDKMSVWVFLVENDDLLKFIQDESHYAMYGAPVLKRICEAYGFLIPKDERALRMAKGLPCIDLCDQGCIKEE